MKDLRKDRLHEFVVSGSVDVSKEWRHTGLRRLFWHPSLSVKKLYGKLVSSTWDTLSGFMGRIEDFVSRL